MLVLEPASTARHSRARLAGGLHRRLGAPAGMVGMSLRGLVGLLQDGLAGAGLAPGDLGYGEIHALGTPVGDAVEMTAWARVWAGESAGVPVTRLGSHKAGFGHLEAPAGLVGVARLLG
ncbi:MAG: hypothetical protein U1E23_16615 [Reyranellaceae bacterium]